MGPPGTGKTLLARAIAGEANVPFFSISGSDFVEMFVGVGASRVRDLFEQGKKHAPCIIFMDEIDAVGRHRGAGLGGGHDEREQTLNQLLVEMDGFETNEGVILIAATNRPDVLDPALLRPGRFDRQVVVPRPDVKGREEILRVHVRRIPLAPNVELKTLARGTPGFSGADLANLVNEAALLAARQNKKLVEMPDFENAKDKVLMGVERRSMIISDAEKRTIAYHEAGHALVADFLPGADPLHKVTIIPRGRALGLTMQLPMDDKYNYSREYLINRITILMGGRTAEEIVLQQQTTGAGDDLEKATEMARKMVCEWGMSDKLGPLTFGKNEEHIFLGREVARAKDYSEETALAIDSEIKRIVLECATRARQILEENIEKLHALARALLERESLDSEEIARILRARAPARALHPLRARRPPGRHWVPARPAPGPRVGAARRRRLRGGPADGAGAARLRHGRGRDAARPHRLHEQLGAADVRLRDRGAALRGDDRARLPHDAADDARALDADGRAGERGAPDGVSHVPGARVGARVPADLPHVRGVLRVAPERGGARPEPRHGDRKSTRLNSSH